MLTWPCSHQTCSAQSMVGAGDCHSCGKHFCKAHNDLPGHACKAFSDEEKQKAEWANSQRERTHLLNIIATKDFCSQASAQRPEPGHTCSMILPTLDNINAMAGGMNLHVPLTFDDGMKWLVRVRQKRFDAPPPAMRRMILDSEVKTMRVLKEAGATVPTAFKPLLGKTRSQVSADDDDDDDDDLDYFFLEWIPGTACSAPIFEAGEPIIQSPQLKLKTTIGDYAKFQIALSGLTFDAVGSLFPPTETDGDAISSLKACSSIIGPLISADICTPSPPFFLGPFTSLQHRYLTTIDFVLAQIVKGNMFVDAPLMAYLFHLELRELVRGCHALAAEEGQGAFYLKHADDKGDHIIVDEQGHITGIIDWEWAYTTSKADAFASPLGLIALDPFFSGSNELTEPENLLMEAYRSLKRPDLAECVRNSRIYHRLMLSIGQSPDLLTLDGLREAMGQEKIGLSDSGDWENWAKEKHKGKTALERLSEIGHMPQPPAVAPADDGK